MLLMTSFKIKECIVFAFLNHYSMSEIIQQAAEYQMSIEVPISHQDDIQTFLPHPSIALKLRSESFFTLLRAEQINKLEPEDLRKFVFFDHIIPYHSSQLIKLEHERS